MTPKISIIIPVYNGEKFIEKCLKSIRVQSMSGLQIIVVDDGSVDKTYNILCKLKALDSRIEVIRQKNEGVSKARNTGLHRVRGEWIIFIDADDFVESDYCESMYLAAKTLQADAVIACRGNQDTKEKYILESSEKLMKACLSFDENSFPFNVDAPWGKIFKASLIQKNNILFPEDLSRSEDAYFCMCAYRYAETIGIFNQFGYNHVEREGSLCRSYAPNAKKTLEAILFENQKWVNNHYFSDIGFEQAWCYRVLPGIVECEHTYFLHPQNKQSLFEVVSDYHRFLHSGLISKAIKGLKMKNVKSRQYQLRLLNYKLHLGWLFILLKRMERKNNES